MAMFLAGAMLVSMTACGSGKDDGAKDTTQQAEKTENAENSSGVEDLSAQERYEATLVFLSSKDPSETETEQLTEAMNAITVPALNTEVTLVPMTVGAYISQAQLLSSGGESYDVIPMLGTNANTFVNSGYLEDLSQYRNELSDTIAMVGEDDIMSCTLGDFTWAIPNQYERTTMYCYYLRADICDELGIDASKVHTHADMTEIYEKVHAAYPDMICLGGFQENNPLYRYKEYDNLGDGLGVLMDMGQSTDVVNFYETEECMANAKLMREWYEAGYVSKDLPTSRNYGDSLMEAGNLFSFVNFYKPNGLDEMENGSNRDLYVAVIGEGVRTTAAAQGFCYSISSTSKDPQRAAQLLNLIFTSPEINDLLIWGIEGQDWVETADGFADFPEGKTAETVPFHNALGWAEPNQFIAHVWTGMDIDVWDQYKEFNEKAIPSAALGFSPDLSDYVDEVSACNSVVQEYAYTIGAGAVDPETSLAEMNAKLYDSGLQKIIDAKQEQLDAWLANK